MSDEELSFDDQILLWIYNESEVRREAGSIPAVPLHLIQLQAASLNRTEDELTMSTEISLNTFDRASFFRVLRMFHQQFLIDLVDAQGEPVDIELSELNEHQDSQKLAQLMVKLNNIGIERGRALHLKYAG